MNPYRLPEMPHAIALARRLRLGESFEDICAQYQRQPKTLLEKLNHAGYKRDGTELKRHPTVVLLTPWRETPRFMEQAACADVDPALFFGDRGVSHGFTKQAKRVCAGCLVRTECLVFALENHERYGVWGGLTTGERRTLLTQLATKKAAS